MIASNRDPEMSPLDRDMSVPGRGMGASGNGLFLDRHLAQRLGRDPDAPHARGPALRRALDLLRLENLGRTLEHARQNSLWYRERLDAALPQDTSPPAPGRDPAEALAEILACLPLTFPEDLAAAPEAFLAVAHDDVAGVISLPTSGTSGTSKRIFCSQADLRETVDFFRHGMRFLIDPARNDRVALLMSGGREGSVGDLLGRAMRDIGVPCAVPGFPLDPPAVLDKLRAFAPTCLVGLPGDLLLLGRLPGGPIRPRTVLLSGEAVSPSLRAAIARAWGCMVLVHYGLTETGLGGAVECPARCGCHLREADLAVEILDATGKPAPAGGWGEIAITTLTRQAMPLLRYCTGDEGRLLPEPCACGSVFTRLEARGRRDDALALPSGACLGPGDLDGPLLGPDFVLGWAATLHHAPMPLLALDVLVRPDAPEQVRATLEQGLAGLPGLRPVQSVRSAQEAAGSGQDLPVLLHIHPGDRRAPGKRRLRREDGPPP